jgi:hypothetical protein
MTAIIEAAEQYSDQLWRLHNLYWIIDKNGKKVKFTPNSSQLKLYHEMWYRNVILKARQRGYTTFIDIFSLDSCIFNPDFAAGIIAHNIEDAKKIFRTKVKHPYDNLPEGIRRAVTASNDRVGEYVFSNGSSISVSTSYRSGTLQILHVSELGKIAAKYPDKAREIRTGAFESVPKTGLIFVESTAEGQGGDFYDMTKKAQALDDEKKELSIFDMKFFFDAWWQNPDYVLDKEVLITTDDRKYFTMLKDDHGIKLSPQQEWWYIAKRETQQDDMKREYPSYPDEAFESAIQGGIYTSQMARARKEGRLCRIPIESGVEVHTFWDLGKNDLMAVWFMQQVGKEMRWIDYYEASMEDIEHYCKVLKDKGYLYGKHYMPHDVEANLLGMKKSRKKQFEEGGVRPVITVPRIPHLIDGIQMVRKSFASYWFDTERCSQGIKNLDSYQWKWNDTTASYMSQHLHNWASNGSDAIRQQAQAYEGETNEPNVELNFSGWG